MSITSPHSALEPRPASSPQGPASSSRRLFISGLIVLLVASAGFGVWKLWLEKRFVAKRWGVVEEGRIYRSGQLSTYLVKETFQRHGIQVVIDLTGDDPSSADQRAERETIAQLGLTSQRFPLIGDGTGDIEQYAGALRALATARQKGQPAVVHCHAGSQRTGGVVAAWRLLFEHAAPEAVLAEMQRFGWRPGRDEILRDYLNANLPELAKRLVDAGCLAEVPPKLPRL